MKNVGAGGRKQTTGRYDTRQELEEQILKGRAKGMETNRIAMRCGCSKGTVNNVLKEFREALEISRELKK
jgi:CRP-like cAMP-binding protein